VAIQGVSGREKGAKAPAKRVDPRRQPPTPAQRKEQELAAAQRWRVPCQQGEAAACPKQIGAAWNALRSMVWPFEPREDHNEKLEPLVEEYTLPYLENLIWDSDRTEEQMPYLKAYFPITAAYTDPVGGRTSQYLDLIIANLPPAVKELAIDEQVDFVCMVLAIMHKESQFNYLAFSDDGSGAMGPMQIKAICARDVLGQFAEKYSQYGGDLGLTSKETDQLLDPANEYGRLRTKLQNDPVFNMKVGMYYLLHLLSLTNESSNILGYYGPHLKFVFAAYRLGESGAMAQYRQHGYSWVDDTTDPVHARNGRYSREVMVRYQWYGILYYNQIMERVSLAAQSRP